MRKLRWQQGQMCIVIKKNTQEKKSLKKIW